MKKNALRWIAGLFLALALVLSQLGSSHAPVSIADNPTPTPTQNPNGPGNGGGGGGM